MAGKIVDIKVVSDKTDAFLSELERKKPKILEMWGQQTENQAVIQIENYPRRIDTGRLWGSITHEVTGDSVIVGTNVEYAIYVHEGTRKMAPNHFLTEAVNKLQDQYAQMVKDELADFF